MAVYSIKYLFFTIECQMNRFFACLYLAVLVSACAECEVIPGVKQHFMVLLKVVIPLLNIS